jgi:hypothetical protein
MCARSRFLLATALLLLPLDAFADEAPTNDRPTRSTHAISITTDPTRAIFGMPLVSGEGRIGRAEIFPHSRVMDIAAAGFVSGGVIRSEDDHLQALWASCNGFFQCDRAAFIWFGGQLLIYPVGDFEHGLQLGSEVSVMRAWGSRSQGSLSRSMTDTLQVPPVPNQRIDETGVMPGIFIGYKLVTRAGLTLNPQLGAAYRLGDESGFALRIALNAGWSF